jgi:hypothetical protein
MVFPWIFPSKNHPKKRGNPSPTTLAEGPPHRSRRPSPCSEGLEIVEKLGSSPCPAQKWWFSYDFSRKNGELT